MLHEVASEVHFQCVELTHNWLVVRKRSASHPLDRSRATVLVVVPGA